MGMFRAMDSKESLESEDRDDNAESYGSEQSEGVVLGELPGVSEDRDKFESYESEQSEGVLGDLPEVCIAMILAFLSPRDVAKLACVCRSFRAASTYDAVWERILPPRFKDILALDPAVDPAQFTSRREIFDRLCKPLIHAGHTQGVWIDRKTGGLCWSIAARGLRIVWGDDLRYWEWLPDQNSLFPEVARLKMVCWFEVTCEIELSLPPGAYTVTWRMLLSNLQGWHNEPAHFTFTKNDDESTECKCHIDPRPAVSSQPVSQFRLPAAIRVIETGWTEYDVAEFSVAKGEETCSLKFSFIAIHSGGWKSNLYLDGVDIRPTEVVKQIQSKVPTLPLPRRTLATPEDPEVPYISGVRRFLTGWPNLGGSWRR